MTETEPEMTPAQIYLKEGGFYPAPESLIPESGVVDLDQRATAFLLDSEGTIRLSDELQLQPGDKIRIVNRIQKTDARVHYRDPRTKMPKVSTLPQVDGFVVNVRRKSKEVKKNYYVLLLESTF